MKEGSLNNVAPGEPGVDESDLKSFLDAGVRRSGTCATAFEKH